MPPGNPLETLHAFFPQLYGDLRAVAARCFRNQPKDHTLQPTALVNELYVRLARSDTEYKDERHFVAVAATAMRQLLVDHARRRGRLKRGGDRQVVQLFDASEVEIDATLAGDLLDLHDALERLADLNARHARVLELRFFGGLGNRDIAELLGVTKTTIDNDVRGARAWLSGQLAERD